MTTTQEDSPLLPLDCTRCSGRGCDRRESCLRYLAGQQKTDGSQYAVWAEFEPENCKFYLEAN